MASLVIESNKPENLRLLAKLAKQLGDKAKLVTDKSTKNLVHKLTKEERHLVSTFKQADLLEAGELKTVNAKKFLNDLLTSQSQKLPAPDNLV